MPDEGEGGARPPDRDGEGARPDRQPAGEGGGGARSPEPTPPGSQRREAARSEDEELHEQGRQALETERARNRELLRRVQELEDAGKSELERAVSRATSAEQRAADAEARLERVEQESLARQVANEAGVGHLWHRLQGSDVRTLRADAARLRQEVGMEAGALDGGARGSGARRDESMDAIIRRRAGR